MTIDFSQTITPEQKAAAVAAARAAALKTACANRIIAVLDERTLLNIQGAVLVGALNRVEMRVFCAGQGWVADMQAACRTAIARGNDPAWPCLPEGVAKLAARF